MLKENTFMYVGFEIALDPAEPCVDVDVFSLNFK